MQNLEPLFHIPTHPQWNMACSKQFWEETWDGKYILKHCSEWFKFELLFNILPSLVRMMIIIATILMMMNPKYDTYNLIQDMYIETY